MLFDNLQFFFFFIVVSVLYYQLRHQARVWMLLLASCYFYMVFKPIYILILLVTILVDYYAGILIAQAEGNKRRNLLIISLITNIGFLAYFKYFNFFHENLTSLLHLFDLTNPIPRFDSELPIGLSFHTFQAMSYTIEVYRRNEKPERNFSIYALYVLFYPQLVAGPIERPQNLLWQFRTQFAYDFENIKQGLIRIAWGLFKKVVIADRLALLVDQAYANPAEQNGSTLFIATLFYTFQIYCDFSGYSDIAIGTARVMGFKLMENFDVPYISKSIAEFWRRWHISLSGWFRDYLYIPLGGNRVGELRLYFNYFLVFMISGLWHGAAWTFIIWGSLHGIYQIAAKLRDKYIHFRLPNHPISSFFHWLTTFLLVMLTWVFFRAKGLSEAKTVLKKISMLHPFEPITMPFSVQEFIFCFLLIGFLMWKDVFVKEIKTRSTWQFGFVLVSLLTASYFFGVFTSNQFIYFQF